MANIQDGKWTVRSIDGSERKIDLSETYYIFYPPMSKEEQEHLYKMANAKLTKADRNRIQYAKRLLIGEKPSRFWTELKKIGKAAFAINHIAPMTGKELKTYCENNGYVPFFDVDKGNLNKIANNYQQKYGTGGDKIIRSYKEDRPHENCIILVHLSGLSHMIENSAALR